MLSQQQRYLTTAAAIGSGDSCTNKASSGKRRKQPTHASGVTLTTGSESSGSKALRRAAKEADRLSQLARSSPSGFSKQKESYDEKTDSSTAGRKLAALVEDSHKIRLEEARKASKALLRITNIQSLANAILHQEDPDMVAKVHRAFISIVTWGLQLIATDPETKKVGSMCLLEELLDVVRRSHELDLPLHIPLYHRLLEQVAAHSSLIKKDDPISAILDITVYATESLDLSSSPKQASAEWLEPLIEQLMMHTNNKTSPRLDYVDRLLHGMRDCLGITQLSFDATLDMLLRLRAIFRKALRDAKKLHYAHEAASIVVWLEPSLVNMLDELNQGPIFPSPSSTSKKENLLHDMLLWDEENPTSDEANALIFSRIFLGGPPPGRNKNNPSRSRKIHPFDIVVDTILTRDLKDHGAKELASDIFQFVRLRSTDEEAVLPEPQKSFSSSSSNTIPTSRSDTQASSVGLSEKPAGADQGDSLSYQVSHHKKRFDGIVDDEFPDVASQLIKWNGDGRPLAYTVDYKAIVGMDEPADSVDPFMRRGEPDDERWDQDLDDELFRPPDDDDDPDNRRKK